MLIFSPDIPMSHEEFRLLRDFIYEHCGLNFTAETRYLLEKRLGRQLRQHNLNSFKDYYFLLRYGANREQELAQAIDLLTTNETYFFREESQLLTFVNEIIPELQQRRLQEGVRRLRIWSAGCSSGEEPYTLAMLLMEAECARDWEIDIIGTDISKRVLQLARQGVYGSNSFRAIPQRYLRAYFEEMQEGKYRIRDQVRQRVGISHLNLFDEQRVGLIGQVDVIFCRNVIIYFDLPGKKKVIEQFHRQLRPGGFLLLGHSESLMSISNRFVLRHFTHDMVYQKPLESEPLSTRKLS